MFSCVCIYVCIVVVFFFLLLSLGELREQQYSVAAEPLRLIVVTSGSSTTWIHGGVFLDLHQNKKQGWPGLQCCIGALDCALDTHLSICCFVDLAAVFRAIVHPSGILFLKAS